MPAGSDPPDPGVTATLFNTLHAMTYDAGQMAFVSGATRYWLFVERKSATDIDVARWFHATDAEGAENPKCLVPQLTFDVFKNGSYNSGNGTISYQGQSYRIRMFRDQAAGKQIAKAIPV